MSWFVWPIVAVLDVSVLILVEENPLVILKCTTGKSIKHSPQNNLFLCAAIRC